MAQVLCQIPKKYDENLIVGLDTSDDAAVYKIDNDLAIIQTLDFFTPVVDDPYIFGQIAAANSLSDVYAMGGEPRLAMNIVCFPDCLSPDILTKILKGGHDKVEEAGAVLVGGHTVKDNEPKYGLSVTGFVHPNKVLTNGDAKVNDFLVLTKPIGTGIINTAIKGGLADKKDYDEAVKVMTTLNKFAIEAANKVGVNGCTDITGFGLLGHSLELAEASSVTLKIKYKDIPLIEGALQYAQMGLVPAGAYSNEAYIGDKIQFNTELPREIIDILYDPQTSGGLLISVPEDKVCELLKELKYTPTDFGVIGQVVEREDKYLIIE